jgi:hypothetical protein
MDELTAFELFLAPKIGKFLYKLWMLGLIQLFEG